MVKDTSWEHPYVTAMIHANPGDLIEFLDPVFRHWAVYADDNDGEPQIVHFYQWDNKGYKVQYDSIENVAAGRQCHVHNKYDNRQTPYNADTIMKRALQCVKESESGTYPSYDLNSWNCEHFASWCRYGVAYSDQTTGRNLLSLENYWWGFVGIVGNIVNGAITSGSSGSSGSSSSGEKKNEQKFGKKMSEKYGNI